MNHLSKSIKILLSFGLIAILSLCGTLFLAEWPHKSFAADLVVRKNVVDLTTSEKKAFVNAIKTLKTTVSKGSEVSIYDQFVAVHLGATRLIHRHHSHQQASELAHENAAFLPWHREYIRRFEQALQAVNQNVTLPYWDWTDPKAIDIIFRDDFLGPNGQGRTISIPDRGNFTGGPVKSSAFSAANGWVLKPDLNIDPNTGKSLGNLLVRFLLVPPANDYPLPKADIDRVLALNDYSLFRTALEGFISVDRNGNITKGGFIHNYIHGLVGGVEIDSINNQISFQGLGTMSNIPSSPYDPVFWLHHANVDRLWAKWQDKGHQGKNFYPAQGQPYGHNLRDLMWPWDGGRSVPLSKELGNLLSKLPTVAPKDLVRPVDVLDYKKLGYTYATHKQVAVFQTGSTFGIFSLGALSAIFMLKRKQQKTLA